MLSAVLEHYVVRLNHSAGGVFRHDQESAAGRIGNTVKALDAVMAKKAPARCLRDRKAAPPHPPSRSLRPSDLRGPAGSTVRLTGVAGRGLPRTVRPVASRKSGQVPARPVPDQRVAFGRASASLPPSPDAPASRFGRRLAACLTQGTTESVLPSHIVLNIQSRMIGQIGSPRNQKMPSAYKTLQIFTAATSPPYTASLSSSLRPIRNDGRA